MTDTPADSFDDLFTITCGKCKATSPLLDWCKVLTPYTFICPKCRCCVQRRLKDISDYDPMEPFYELVEIK